MKFITKEIQDFFEGSDEVALYDSNEEWVGMVVTKERYQILFEALQWQENSELKNAANIIIKDFKENPDSKKFKKLKIPDETLYSITGVKTPSNVIIDIESTKSDLNLEDET